MLAPTYSDKVIDQILKAVKDEVEKKRPLKKDTKNSFNHITVGYNSGVEEYTKVIEGILK